MLVVFKLMDNIVRKTIHSARIKCLLSRVDSFETSSMVMKSIDIILKASPRDIATASISTNLTQEKVRKLL